MKKSSNPPMEEEGESELFETDKFYEVSLAEDTELSLEDVEACLSQLPKSHNSPLYNVDYNLNSPLIRDQADALLSKLRGTRIAARFERNTTIYKQYKSLSAQVTDWKLVQATNGFHKWAATRVFPREMSTSHFYEQWDTRMTEIVLPMEIVTTFWHDLTGKKPPSPEYLLRAKWLQGEPQYDWQKKLLSEGENFWFFHIITLIMNSKDKEERDNLIKQGVYLNLTSLKITSTAKKDRGCYLLEGSHPDYGRFYVGPGCLYLKKEERLLDRNMVLMLKDTLIARFCSKMCLLNRAEPDSTTLATEKLTEVYHLGDQILRELDSDGYKALRLLEPVCNLRLAELAAAYRPEIPVSPRFREFLLREIAGQEELAPGVIHNFFSRIMTETSFIQVIVYYGIFRHWGHPFIDYLAGLNKLHEQVQAPKKVDVKYANALASDLAYIVLKHEFDQQKKWFVDPDQMEPDDPLRDHVLNCTWPTPVQIEDVGDRWHLLPLLPCYEVPQTIDPAVLYADKSHSPNYEEIYNHIASGTSDPIPSKKVLITALRTEQRNLREFLKLVNDRGLPRACLAIGLKGKERELKEIGRFFSLMTWALREYFVSTEYLIKTYFVPLFEGLTMADDLKGVTRKILDCSAGQGNKNSCDVGFANHLDYEKWNNHQRKESTSPVFTVMGQFLGLPKLIARTHEFFEQSFIYYGDRPDLMTIKDGEIVNVDENQKVCWNGQLGGLEGLRQKGWSVLNLLVILRESKIRNTKVRVLAQGDNQVICTKYKIPSNLDVNAHAEELEKVFTNNMTIIDSITLGANKLGLIINKKETLIASDYLTYSKVPVFRGNIYPHEVKRYSRVTCIPNDQIPTIASAVAAVATSSLTVAQFSNSLLNPMACYCLFGTMVLSIHRFHSPLLKKAILDGATAMERQCFMIRALYLDPVLGGTSGTSLTRFLIRQFPDPVTESLSFWKRLGLITGNSIVKLIALEAGHPPLASNQNDNLSKLLEKPMSLNIPKGLSATTLLKAEIRKGLTDNLDEIQNVIVRESLRYQNAQEANIKNFLLSVRPLFPRFLSEFYSATFIGITEGILGLFQNSRTIRNTLSHRFNKRVNTLLTLSEALCVKTSSRAVYWQGHTMWPCSAELADKLRRDSWGEGIVATTVPHPYELIHSYKEGSVLCSECPKGMPERERVTVDFPHGFPTTFTERGPLCAYLGSATTESTSLFQPWEKEVRTPLLERATRLRVAVNWFVRVGSNLSNAIFENLKALTGWDWFEMENVFYRTGCPGHRYRSSRQSNGGFSAISPNGPMWVMVTADTMPTIGKDNYDFMYQSLMLYAQTVSLETKLAVRSSVKCYHFHIQCKGCLRELKEFELDTTQTLQLPDVSEVVSSMSGGTMPDLTTLKSLQVAEGSWEDLTPSEKCFHIGVAQGALYGFYCVDNDGRKSDTALFPISLLPYLEPRAYLTGILKGVLMAAAYDTIYRRLSVLQHRPKSTLLSAAYHVLECLCKEPSFITVLNKESIMGLLTDEGHRVTPSYPSSGVHLGAMGLGFLSRHLTKNTLDLDPWRSYWRRVWIFSDFKSPKLVALMLLGHELWLMLKAVYVPRAHLSTIRQIKDIIHYYCALDLSLHVSETPAVLNKSFLGPVLKAGSWCSREVRHATQALPLYRHIHRHKEEDWGQEICGGLKSILLDYSSRPTDPVNDVILVRVNDPLISGLRPFQMATGAHYKLRCLLKMIPFVQDCIVGGDGSGGMTACLLREFRSTRCIFNSLLDLSDRHLRGVAPSPPSAITALPSGMRNRCVNLQTAWENPCDLREEATWSNFEWLIRMNHLTVNLIVLDMEVVDELSIQQIVKNLREWIHKLMKPNGCLIFKLYGTREQALNGQTLSLLGSLFKQTHGAQTQFSSFGTSEFYLVGVGLIEGKILAPYIETNSLRELLDSLGAAKHPKEEFHRALSISPKDMWMGVPRQMRPDPVVEFLGLFSSLGLETGVASDLAFTIQAQIQKGVKRDGLVLTVLILLSNAILPITRWMHLPIAPPSDQRLQKLLSGFMGCWEFLAWSYSAYGIHERLQSKMYRSITFWYRANPRKVGKSKGHCLEWSFTPMPWPFKQLPKLEHHATIGQVIRVFSYFWPTRETAPFSSYKQLMFLLRIHLRSFNRGLRPEDVLSHTGLFEPVLGPRLIEDYPWMGTVGGRKFRFLPGDLAAEEVMHTWED
nr:MAG: RNA-dependent RNA polymerase [Rhipicephalus associated rhabdo-like virus]